MGWTTLTVGHLNILSATFAVMLIGMGDYGVLWVMRYEEARRLGADVRTALLHTTTHVAIGNLTAATTLALAFFAAILADFRAVSELGWIAGCGVRLNYAHNLLHLQARDLESVKWELTLIEHTAGASWHALSITASPAEALALKGRYEHLPEVSRVVEAASLVPGDQSDKLDMLRDIRHRLRSLPPPVALIRHLRPAHR